MRVAIYGAGAMGTVLGAYISKAGYQIDLINRNKDHVTCLNNKGAQIIGKIEFVQEVNALLPDDMTGKYDIILLMTKQKHNKEIVKFIKPFLSTNGVICTMQNGLPEQGVADVIGKDKTFGCTMSWGATLHGDGISELTSDPNPKTLTFSIGKFGDNDDTVLEYIVTLLETMGHVKVEENFVGARWAKLLVNSAFSGLSVITGETFGIIASNRPSRKLALGAIKECIDVASASGIRIEPIQGKDVVKLLNYNNWFKKQISLFLIPIALKKHSNIKSSMLRDIKLGRKTEIDSINGIVCDYGDRVNIDTPINDAIVSIARDIENQVMVPHWHNLKSIKLK